MKFLKKNKKTLMWITISTLSLFVIWYTFVLCKCIMSSDSAFVIDYVEEMFKYKSLFPKTWINSNDFWIYSLIPLIAIFMKLNIGMFMSRQISVIIQTVILFALIIQLFKTLKIKKGILAFIVLLLSGVSAQFMFEMFGDGTYTSITIYILLGLLMFIKYFQTKKIGYSIALFILLAFVCSFSLRFPIHISAPLIACLVYMSYSNRKIKKEYIISLVSILLGTLIGYIIYNYLTNTLLFNSYVSKDIIYTGPDLTKSIQSTVFNYLFMCGATGKSIDSLSIQLKHFISPTSPLILITFIKLIFAIFTLLIPFKLHKNIEKFTNEERITYIFVVSFSLLLLFFVLISDMFNMHRYITLLVFFLLFLYPMYYKYYIDEDKVKRVLYGISIGLCSIASIILVLDSTVDFEINKVRNNYYDILSQELISMGLHYGYTDVEGEQNIYYMISEGNVRISRISYSYDSPFYWLNSIDWYKKGNYDGKVFFISNPTFKKSDGLKKIEEASIDSFNYNEYEVYIFENEEAFLNILDSTEYVPIETWEDFDYVQKIYGMNR